MSRPEITLSLAAQLERYIDPRNDPRIYWAKEITFDYGSEHSVRVDYMRFKPLNNTVSGIEKGDFYCYEIKSSVDDFKSKNGHNFLGDVNYYVMPESVFEAVKNLIPYRVGVLIPGKYGMNVLKKAQRMNRTKPASEMLLMMWRSSRRELVKIRRAETAQREEGQAKPSCHTCGHDCAGIDDGPCRDYAPCAAQDKTTL